MAEPPKTPPHSDIEGVNRDARIGAPSKDPKPDPGAMLGRKHHENKGRPEERAPEEADHD